MDCEGHFKSEDLLELQKLSYLEKKSFKLFRKLSIPFRFELVDLIYSINYTWRHFCEQYSLESPGSEIKGLILHEWLSFIRGDGNFTPKTDRNALD
ncbi:hypothetical protein TNCT_427691 [Trichonephila clavata]|uniref:Uncharacterized protein n=1 Tax=Trichonephila clavata TaxID=2740835 RepID=A0A8X6G632_TRICU|nr:hypothetical protein TNCT_427691 [Trichonephila clavata]